MLTLFSARGRAGLGRAPPRREGRCCDLDGFITSPHFNAKAAAAGFSRSGLRQSHGSPRLLCLLQAWIHSCPAPACLHPGSRKPAGRGHLLEPGHSDKNLQTVGCPRGAGTWLGKSIALETPLSWGQEIKLCSDTQILQNSENRGRMTPKPECVPWGAWAERGL